jgi:hypothetical protein
MSPTINKSFTHTNATSGYQVVGNYQTVISHGHKSLDDAAKSFDDLHRYVEESGYGVVSFVAPGETVSGAMMVANPDYVEPAPMSAEQIVSLFENK